MLYNPFYNILTVIQGFLGASFFDIPFVFLEFSCNLLFDFWFYYLDFPCIYIFYIPAAPQDFPDTLLSDMLCFMFNFPDIFFYTVLWNSFLSVYLFLTASSFFSGSSFFWIFFHFSFQVFLTFYQQSLLFQWTFNSTHGIGNAVNCYKLHLKIQNQWVSIVIKWSYIIF